MTVTHPEMWFKSRLTQATAKLSSLTASSRNRRIIFIILAILVIFTYFGPSYFGRRTDTLKATDDCLKRHLSEYSDLLKAHNVLISRPGEGNGDYPYIGNGNIGVNVRSGGPMYIRYHNKMTVKIPYAPLVQAYLVSDVRHFREATVINYKTGEAIFIQAFSVMGSCVLVESTVYAHRTRPSVLVQEMSVNNPLMSVLEVNLRQPSIPWENSQLDKTEANTVQMGKVEVRHNLGAAQVSQSVVVAVSTSEFPGQLSLVSKSSATVQVTSLVEYSEPMLDTQITLNVYTQLKDILKTETAKLAPISIPQLKGEHTELWQELWQAGVSVEHPSMVVAGGNRRSLGGLSNLNATFYYVLSAAETPMLKKEEIAQHGSCYNGLPTLFDKSYWLSVSNHQEYADLVSLWTHTLYKHGCVDFLRTGSAGVIQAMLLSLLGGQFTHDHLSFTADPRLFRHNTFIKGISYGAGTGSFDLDILVSDHRVTIRRSSAGQEGKGTLYACGAGCRGEPSKLTRSELTELPLEWTRPKTSFLYLAKSQESLLEMKKMIHFKSIDSVEVTEKPEPDHHSQGLHIPTSIWLLIASLILVFHLFLIKIIYNEYCQKSVENKPPRIKPLQYT